MTTLGRPESFRTAYQAALHDLAQMTAERDALRAESAAALEDANVARLRVVVKSGVLRADMERLQEQCDTATARADAAEAEVTRLRAFVAEKGIVAAHSGYQECLECGSFGYFPDNDLSRHESGCIVAEARRAQKEATQ